MLVCVIYDFLYLYVYVSACVLHTCLSVSLKCLTVLSCPQSVKSRNVETSKNSEGKVGMKERQKGNNRSRKSFYGFSAVDVVCLLFSFPLPPLVLCYCCLSGRHEAR